MGGNRSVDPSNTVSSCWKPSLSWHLLPIILGITAICGMITTYALAKYNCHIEKWFLPYISYTGTEHPESSVFGLLLNLEGFLGFIIVVLAWRFMKHAGDRSHLSSAALVAGLLSCFGVILVGNFQVSKNKVPHYIGAALAFIVGSIYCILTSILTHRLHRSMPNRSLCCTVICVIRYAATCFMVMSIVILMTLAAIRTNYNETHKKLNPEWEKLRDYEFRFPNGSCVPIIHKVPVYKRYLDLAGSILEWLLTFCLLLSLSLWAYEFKTFQNVKITLKRCGTELNIVQLQNSILHNSFSVVSPNSTLLHSYSDSTIVIHHVPDKSQSSSDETDSSQQMCPNNNKSLSTDICQGSFNTCKCNIAKSMPIIFSSDIEEV